MKRYVIAAAAVATLLAAGTATVYAQGKGQQGGQRATPPAQQADRDYDRQQQQQRNRAPDEQRDRDQDRDQLHRPDSAPLKDEDIFGYELMSARERNEYREQLRKLETEAQRKEYVKRHREMIESRAAERGIELKAGHGRDEQEEAE